MTETVIVNDEEVQTYDKSAFEDYRSKWTRRPDVIEVDEDEYLVPQYSHNFPPVDEYPDEIYEETGCMPVDEVQEKLALGQDVIFWNGPPCNENAYLQMSIVQELPPVEYYRINKPTTMSDEHITCHNGRPMGKMFGPIQSQVRLDCIVALGDDVQVVD